jgi:ABC-type branched-subunit amino acid transport system ATPase component
MQIIIDDQLPRDLLDMAATLTKVEALILDDLRHGEGKTIMMVEQNAKKGLEFADIGYVLVSGQLAKAGPGDELLQDPDVGRLFLGG